MNTLLAAVLLAATSTTTAYRFDDVDRKVVLTSGTTETRVSAGHEARGGDKVETGWFSHAVIASEGHRATFELFSATEVTLASETPGVILSLERGRIRAAFDKITGNEPRVVQTPGALLAVRGTEFDVRVDREGNTTVDVFEGIVEIQSPLRKESLFVGEGQQSTHGRQRPPVARPMPEQRRREHDERVRDRNGDGDRTRRPEGDGRRDPRTQPPPDRGGQNPPRPPSQQQPPPPRKPPE